MATAEVGALRVSLSLDSAAFTAGSRAAASTAVATSQQIQTAFVAANARVAASFAQMTTFASTQLRAGLLSQMAQLRTGLLGLVSPVGLILTGASVGLAALFSRTSEASNTAAEAARVHAEAVERLNDAMEDTRDKSPEYIQARQNETRAEYEAALGAANLARARLDAFRTTFAGVAAEAARIADQPLGELKLTLQNLFGVGVGAEAGALFPEFQALQAEIVRSEALVDSLQQMMTGLDMQARRSRVLEILGMPLEGGGGGGGGGSTEPVDKLTDAQRAVLEKAREFEERQTELVREGEEKRRQLRETALSTVGSIFGSLAKIVGDGSEKAFRIAKGFSIAEAVINVAQGITKALAGPFPFLNAAAIAAAGAAQIMAIRRTEWGGGGGVPSVPSAPTGGGDSGGGGSAAATVPQNVNIHLTGGPAFSSQQIRDLIKQINREQPNGPRIQVYP